MKNIVICCDGTSNQFGDVNTNVVRLVQVLEQSNAQLVYYDPGVGTMPAPRAVGKPAQILSKIFGLAFGAGLVSNVVEAYSFLMDWWEPGDEVFLFGFSRGAYTVRVLAGMLYQMGLLRPGQAQLVPYALKLYRSRPSDEQKYNTYTKRCEAFRNTFSCPVPDRKNRHFPVHFIGAWDTVSSVGWVWNPKTFAHTWEIPSVEHIRHAVALDERRAFFRQNLFSAENSDLVERWFAGAHCDVGGGAKRAVLWPIAFEWMLQEAQPCGLKVDPNELAQLQTKEPPPAELQSALPEQSLTWYWWPAEAVLKWPYNFGLKRKRPRINLGRPRYARHAVLHRSVALRIQNVDAYRPLSLPPAFVDEIAAGKVTTEPITVPDDDYRPPAPWFAYLVLVGTWAVLFATIVGLADFLWWCGCWLVN